jgi:DNA-binding NtrC family response regulator/ATP/maltotriose-dependent transcriptional regulator MalT
MTEEGSIQDTGGNEAERQSGANQLADALAGEDDAPLVARVEGLAATHLQRREQALREAAEAAGCRLFVIGGISASCERHRFADVVRGFVSDLSDRGELSQTARRLFEWLFQRSRGESAGAVDMDSQTYRNSLCRLWVELTRQAPAVLAVSHPRDLPTSERDVLRQLIEYYYLDPVDEILDGQTESDPPRGGVVWLRRPGVDAPWIADDRVVTLQSGEGAESSVRTFLERDDVIDRLVEATEGDPQRLEALVDALPADTTSIWKMRLRELNDTGRQLVALLGAGGGSLPIDWFEAATAELLEGASVSRETTELSDAGFIDKRIADGELEISLFDDQLGEVALAGLDESRQTDIYGALVDGIDSLDVSEADVDFMADLLLEAGRLEKGVRLGMRAARQMYADTSLQQAQAWFERLLEVTEGADVRREILEYLVGIYAGNGHLEAAFEGLDELDELTDGAEQRADAEMDVIDKLIRTGDPETALERVVNLREQLDAEGADEPLRLELIEAKVRAKSGDRMAARRLLVGLSDALTSDEPLVREVESSGGETEIALVDAEKEATSGRLLVEARNELGNLAMFNGELGFADTLYDRNEKVARFHGWQHEVERAEVNRAVVDSQRGEYERALQVFQQILAGAPVSSGVKQAKLLLNAATCHERLDAFDQAIETYRDALREARRIGDAMTFGFGAFNLASLLLRMGAFQQAENLLDRIRGAGSDVPNYGILDWYPTARYADVLAMRGDFEGAVDAYDEVRGRDTAGQLPWLGRWLKLRGARAHVGSGRLEEASEIVAEVRSSADGQLNEHVRALADAVKGAIALERGDDELARQRTEGTAEILYENGDFLTAAFAQKARVRLFERNEQSSRAADALSEAIVKLQRRLDKTPAQFEESLIEAPVHQWLLRRVLRHRDDLPNRLVSMAQRRVAEVDDESDAEVVVEEVEALRREFPQIVGRNESLLEIFRRVGQVAESRAPVLIEGESGTGKELVADAVHRHSDRSNAPFVKLNCGAFVDELLMSELFGHEKGAFTGAVEQKEGRFEQADGGTIFLDEIGDISPKAQVSLLRVLQSGEYERVGGTETRQADVRVVCATHRSLDELVESGEFRLDLYYRLKGIVLELPALRERRSDIPLLVHHFAERFSDDEPTFSRRALEFLCSYSWPGNVRELKNFVRTVLLFNDDARVDVSDIEEFRDFFSEGSLRDDPPEIDYEIAYADSPECESDDEDRGTTAADEPVSDVAELNRQVADVDHEDAIVQELIAGDRSLKDLKATLEEQSIAQALRETGGNITQAAELLDMTRPRLSQIVNGDDELLALKEQLVS